MEPLFIPVVKVRVALSLVALLRYFVVKVLEELGYGDLVLRVE